jgi:hypothetical protein
VKSGLSHDDPISAVAPEDWALLQTIRPNLLLIGDRSRVEPVLTALRPMLRAPVASGDAGSGALPGGGGTIIVRAPLDLGLDEQQRLLERLNDTSRPMQVVTTSDVSLLPAVEAGRFLPSLYYRLNVLTVMLGAGTA